MSWSDWFTRWRRHAPAPTPAPTPSPTPSPTPTPAPAPTAAPSAVTVPNKTVVFSAPFSDASQWTVGRTSSYPGSSPQTNPGDYKSDRISPSISAPDADGTFKAVRNGSYWDADLVTTEYAPGNFQARVGDSLTATVTLNAVKGAWPAIWTWSTGSLQGLPGHGEVDLFEYHGENASVLEFTNHVTSGASYPSGVVQSGVPFELRVDFDAAGVKFFVNGTLKFTAGGLPANWKSNLIVNMSVASASNPYHGPPAAGVNTLSFKVQNLRVWR